MSDKLHHLQHPVLILHHTANWLPKRPLIEHILKPLLLSLKPLDLLLLLIPQILLIKLQLLLLQHPILLNQLLLLIVKLLELLLILDPVLPELFLDLGQIVVQL